MNRQDPFLLSSSRREISPASENVRTKSIGCMSGFFQFVCKYHNRRRFLTSGKKHEKNAIDTSSSDSKVPPSPPQEYSLKHPKLSTHAVVPRSPTLPSELRDSSSQSSRAPALVARLMGLTEVPTVAESIIGEKRRRLLGALEKCDEDLKALKKMIDVVGSAGDNGNNIGNRIKVYHNNSAKEEKGELDVTVVDEVTRSAMCGYSKTCTTAPIGRMPLQRKNKKPGEEDNINISLYDRIKNGSTLEEKYEHLALVSWSNKAMMESVNEVCRDIEWGQRREIGRIGLTLQDFICRDLIEEIVKEMECLLSFQLPLESCKRSLRF